MSSIKIFSLIATLTCLGGCVSIEQPSAITDSPRQMCNAADENSLRAANFYHNKKFSTSAVFVGVNKDVNYIMGSQLYDTYNVTLNVDEGSKGSSRISVLAKTTSLLAAANMSKGQKVQVSGTITEVSTLVNSCVIRLDYATFSS